MRILEKQMGWGGDSVRQWGHRQQRQRLENKLFEDGQGSEQQINERMRWGKGMRRAMHGRQLPARPGPFSADLWADSQPDKCFISWP